MANEIAQIATDAVSPPAGHYSQATSWRELVFVSGQFGRRQDGSHTFDQPFEVQARQALDNLLAILREADCGPEQILRVTVFIAGVENWAIFNRIYAERLGEAKPARTVVPVQELHHGYLVEVEAIAARRPPIATLKNDAATAG